MELMTIPVSKIVNSEALRQFSPEMQKLLEDSLAEHGLLNPLVVRPIDNDRYEVIDGHARLKAAKTVGLNEIICRVMEMTDKEVAEVKLSTTSHKVQPTPNEYGNQLNKLLEIYTFEELAAKLNMTVARLKRLHDQRDK